MTGSNIDRSNYEAWFLDYAEGNLDAHGVERVLKFVEENPDLRAELDLRPEDLTLTPQTSAFEFSHALKKTEIPSQDEMEINMALAADGLLASDELAQLDVNVKAYGLEKVYRRYLNSKLKADLTIALPDRSALKVEAVFSIDAKNADEMIISSAEGLLSPMEKAIVEAWASENGSQRIYAATLHAKLIADSSEVFENKKSLKRPVGIVIPVYIRVAVAAAAVLAILLFIPGGGNQPLADKSNNPGIIPIEKSTVTVEPKLHEGFALISPNVTSYGHEKKVIIEPVRSPDLVTHRETPIDTLPYDRKLDDNMVKVKNDVLIDTIPGIDQLEQPDQSDDIAVEAFQIDDSKKFRNEEPIRILTDYANSRLGTDVSFIRKKDVEKDEYIAYSLKLGRFEFERKKSR